MIIDHLHRTYAWKRRNRYRFALADKLKINYYDAEILIRFEKMDAEKEDIEDHSNYVEELKGKIAKKQVLESFSRISENTMDFRYRMLFSLIRVT